jgi:UDP-N-acetylglucosamine 2-epimerase (non-hydrolysing)
MNKIKVMTLLGIRPDLIRMSKLIKMMDESSIIEHVFVHTGQHYSENLDKIFYEQLNLRNPDLNLKIGRPGQSLGNQLASLMIKVEEALDYYKPEYVILLGDTNTALASIIIARKNIKLVHIEAGMRSFDWRMPEEKNRIVADHLSDILYIYLQDYANNAILEGIDSSKISVVGNPIVDIVNDWAHVIDDIDTKSITMSDRKNFLFATIHREENVENPESLTDIISSLKKISKIENKEMILTLMPRTKSSLERFGIDYSEIKTIDPVGFFECLALQKYSSLVFTDSGTIQEESCILGTKCLTLRNSTERPQAMECGAGILGGTELDSIMNSYYELREKPAGWSHPFGDGASSKRILMDLEKRIQNQKIEKPWINKRISRGWVK